MTTPRQPFTNSALATYSLFTTCEHAYDCAGFSILPIWSFVFRADEGCVQPEDK